MMQGAKTWEGMRAELSAADRSAITRRAGVLKKAEVLAQVREAAMKKQSEVRGMTQYGVSRLEHRDDWLVSSLNAYVRGMGGTLKIVAELPGVGEVELPVNANGQLRRRRSGTSPGKAAPRRRSS